MTSWRLSLVDYDTSQVIIKGRSRALPLFSAGYALGRVRLEVKEAWELEGEE